MKVSDYMKLKLNNKGYMLVEIILASAIAFGLAFFIIDLTIKLKNKNDDLMVETLMNTDRTIINNKLMSYAKEEEGSFNCNNLKIKDTNTITYNDNVIDTVNAYGIIDWNKKECSTNNGKISIKIPISVPQMPDKEYDIIFDYKYEIGDMEGPKGEINLEVVDNNKMKATIINLHDEQNNGELVEGYYLSNTNITCNDNVPFITSKDLSYIFSSTVLEENKTYYVCAKVRDNIGNKSYLSNNKTVVCKTYKSCNKCQCENYGNYICTKYDWTVYANEQCASVEKCTCTPYNGSTTHSRCDYCSNGYYPCTKYSRCSECGCETLE